MLKRSSHNSRSAEQAQARDAQKTELQRSKPAVRDKSRETAARYRAVKWLAEKCLVGFTALWLTCAYSLYKTGISKGLLSETDIIGIRIYALILLSIGILVAAFCFIFSAGKGDSK